MVIGHPVQFLLAYYIHFSFSTLKRTYSGDELMALDVQRLLDTHTVLQSRINTVNFLDRAIFSDALIKTRKKARQVLPEL